MKLINRLLLFVISVIALFFLHCYAPDIGHVDLVFLNNSLSASFYIILIFLIVFFFMLSVVKNTFRFFEKLFSKNKIHEQLESINNLATLILLRGKDFFVKFRKMQISRDFEVIKKSLLIKNGFDQAAEFSLTGNDTVDIQILKLKLQKALEKDEVTSAVEIAQRIIKNYPSYAYVAQEEILKTNVIAYKNKIEFVFDPRKYKYNIAPSFVERYLFEIEKEHLEEIRDVDDRLKFLEKLTKKFFSIPDPINFLLRFVRENNIHSFTDKNIIALIKRSFEILPDRNLAYDLIRLNKPDQFEIAQEITANINNDQPEKLLFLLIVSLKSGFSQKSKEIMQKLKTKEALADGLALYYKLKQD